MADDDPRRPWLIGYLNGLGVSGSSLVADDLLAHLAAQDAAAGIIRVTAAPAGAGFAAGEPDPRVEPLHRAHCTDSGCRADSTWVDDLRIADAYDPLRRLLTDVGRGCRLLAPRRPSTATTAPATGPRLPRDGERVG